MANTDSKNLPGGVEQETAKPVAKAAPVQPVEVTVSEVATAPAEKETKGPNPNLALVAEIQREADSVPELPAGFAGRIRSTVGLNDANGKERNFKPGQERELHAALMELDEEVRRRAFMEFRHFNSIGGSLKAWALGVDKI